MGRAPTEAELRGDSGCQGVGEAIAAGVSARWRGEHLGWRKSSWALLLAAGLIVAATLAAFGNSFAGVFVFDDEFAILTNPTIRQLWPPWQALCPPGDGAPVTGRPLLNLSLAVNYAISGEQVWSYHAANLAIHLLGALLLFGILRRTLLLPALQQRRGAAATPLALTIALMWAIHPLQTESVTYVAQRAESLGGMFYLLTLYCFLRGACSARASFWYAGSALSCVLGMASKEVMVSAPVVVLLYDRTFLAGSFRAAWRKRWGLYVALAGSWLLLGWLVYEAANRGGTAGFGVGVSPWSYLGTQCGAIVHYLRLCVWPRPLVLDYGMKLTSGAEKIVPYAIVVGVLAAATLVALWRWPQVGFLGAWFFAILAPSSSIVPVQTQTVAEHRMYLPLAAVVAGVVLGGYAAGASLWRRGMIPRWAWPLLGGLLAVLAAAALGILTFQRNLDYRSGVWIWQDTVAKVPANERACNNLGDVLLAAGKPTEAIEYYHKALRLKPDYPRAYKNLGRALADVGRVDEAIDDFEHALQLQPDYVDAHDNLGKALLVAGKVDEAIDHYQQVLRLKPNAPDGHNNMGVALADAGRVDEAIDQYERALRLKPDYAQTHYNLAMALADAGRVNEAIDQYEQALRLDRSRAEAHNNLAGLLLKVNNIHAAIEHYRQALQLRPDYVLAHINLAAALVATGSVDEAIDHYEQALRLKPNDAATCSRLADALLAAGRTKEGTGHCDQILRVTPDSIAALNSAAWLLATSDAAAGGDPARAVQLAEQARELAGEANAAMLDTLAAAYAAAGRFTDAVTTAEKAAELAESAGQSSLASRIRARLYLYRANQPYRAAANSSGTGER